MYQAGDFCTATLHDVLSLGELTKRSVMECIGDLSPRAKSGDANWSEKCSNVAGYPAALDNFFFLYAGNSTPDVAG